MRTFIVLILSCASVLTADTGIRVITTAKTNAQSGAISTKDIFTRDGQTNLVRDTRTKAGVIRIRIHRFYHNGALLGDFVDMQDSSGFTTEVGSPYSMTFEFGDSKDVRSAVIGTKEGVVLDAFTCTNGLFFPVESSVITKANSDVRTLLAPEHVGETSREDFGREAERLIEKHKPE